MAEDTELVDADHDAKIVLHLSSGTDNEPRRSFSPSLVIQDASHASLSATSVPKAPARTSYVKKRKYEPPVDKRPQRHMSTISQDVGVNENALQSYIAELNEEMFLVNDGDRYDEGAAKRRKIHEDLQTSQIGVTIWTAEEKSRLFNALAIYGKDDLVSLAAAIKTSIGPVQVKEYLTLLEDGSAEYKRKLGRQKWKLMLLQDQTAAQEVDEGVDQMLDTAAHTIESRQRLYEENEEYKLYGDYWVLDHEVGLLADHAYRRPRRIPTRRKQIDSTLEVRAESKHNLDNSNEEDERDDIEMVLQIIPAAQLLILSNFIHLSSTLFMSSFDCEEMEQKPGIRLTAFSDLHNLIISVTRRIVSVILFLATIENREPKRAGHVRDTVRPLHVFAALDTLNMRRNADEYWMQLPRRCGLQVVDDGDSREEDSNNPTDVNDLKFISWEETERLLSQPVIRSWADDKRSQSKINEANNQGLASDEVQSGKESGTGNSDDDDLDGYDDGSESNTSDAEVDSGQEESVDATTGESRVTSTEQSQSHDDNEERGSEEDSSTEESDDTTSTQDEPSYTGASIIDDSHRRSSVRTIGYQVNMMDEILAQEAAEEAYLEARDQQESAYERARLMRLLSGNDSTADRVAMESRLASTEPQIKDFEAAVLRYSDGLLELTEVDGDWRDHADDVAS